MQVRRGVTGQYRPSQRAATRRHGADQLPTWGARFGAAGRRHPQPGACRTILNGEVVMKKLIAAVALVMALASPAFAQSYNPDVGSGNIVPYAGVQAPQSNADNAHAQVSPRAAQRLNQGARA